MKYIKLYEEINLDEDSAEYYIGVDLEDAIKWCSGIKIPTEFMNLYPLDWEVIKYSNDEVRNMNGEEVDEYVKEICPWYDGKVESIEGGLNLLGNFDNSLGYGDFILGIYAKGEVADFSEGEYSFLKDANDAEVIFVYDTSDEIFYSPKEFELKISAKKYNI